MATGLPQPAPNLNKCNDSTFKLNHIFVIFSDAENLLAKLGHWEMPNALFVIKVAPLYMLWIVRDQTLYSALSNVLEVVIESL